MPSERTPRSHFPRGGWWAWLTSQQLGILCGLSTVALLAIGSIVLTVTRDGASANVAMDDVRVFFLQPSPVHLWFYALCGVLALYALNTLLATWQSVSRKWQFGMRAPRMYAPAIIHIGFLVGLLAHLVGGLASDERNQVLVGPSWTALGDGREARVTDLDLRRNADGSMRQASAALEVRQPDRPPERAVVRYNGPLSTGFGSDLFLLIRPTALPAARLVRGDAQCVVSQERELRTRHRAGRPAPPRGARRRAGSHGACPGGTRRCVTPGLLAVPRSPAVARRRQRIAPRVR